MKVEVGDPPLAEIIDMFRVYETEDGLLIPGSMLDDLDNRWVAGMQLSPLLHPTAHKTQRPSKPRVGKTPRDSGKKEVDDRQLKLFDDE